MENNKNERRIFQKRKHPARNGKKGCIDVCVIMIILTSKLEWVYWSLVANCCCKRCTKVYKSLLINVLLVQRVPYTRHIWHQRQDCQPKTLHPCVFLQQSCPATPQAEKIHPLLSSWRSIADFNRLYTTKTQLFFHLKRPCPQTYAGKIADKDLCIKDSRYQYRQKCTGGSACLRGLGLLGVGLVGLGPMGLVACRPGTSTDVYSSAFLFTYNSFFNVSIHA